MNVKQSINYALVSMVIAASTSACMLEELRGDESGVALEAVVLPEQPDELATIGDVEDASYDDEMEGPVIQAGCAHIQWCNEPGPAGTVCIWDACSFDAAWRECMVDANHVCGGITQPFEFR